MTQPIPGSGRPAWPPLGSPEPAGAAPPPPPTLPSALADPPDLPDFRPVPSPRLSDPRSVATVAVAARATDSAVRARLDAFRASMSGPYHTRDGDCWAPTPFRMAHPDNHRVLSTHRVGEMAAAVTRIAGLGADAMAYIEVGRGAPGDIRRLTQALIDDYGRPPDGGKWTEQKIRTLMFEWGIGIDCAGYVQQAYLFAAELSRSRAGFGRILDEALFNLGSRGFHRVPSPADLRPGDLVVFGSPGHSQPGHRVIVYDQRPATVDELRRFTGSTNRSVHDFANGGPILKVLADSSWGNYGVPEAGGVERHTWWYNEKTKVWGYMNLRPYERRDDHGNKIFGLRYEFQVGSRPSEDPLEGFYRRGAP